MQWFELYVVDENLFNDFLIGKRKWISYVIKAYLIYDIYLVYIVEAFVTKN